MDSVYGAGFKPVAHQAPIVLTARVTKTAPNDDNKRDMTLKCNKTAQPGMLAFVDTKSVSYSHYPEPVYHVNIKDCNQDHFSFLGIVQTPGNSGGLDTYNGSSDTNVVHAGGTMTTFNTGQDIISCNDLVMFDFNQGNGAETTHLPKGWRTYKSSDCKFARTVKYDYVDTNAHRIIGRAIRTSQPGQQLDLIMAF